MRAPLLLLGLLALITAGAALPDAPAAADVTLRDVDTLPAARALFEDKNRLVIELPGIDVPAAVGSAEGMVVTPIYRVDIPASGAIHRFAVELIDADGVQLPQKALHHVNLTDPYRRELFLPIGLHVLAASKETKVAEVPWWLFGLPIEEGQRYIISAMVANDRSEPARGVRVRLVLDLTPAGRPWPLFKVYPWVMDVLFPLGQPGGSKAFDLPPGVSEHSWEARPAIEGTILGMGGHVHDYATRLLFLNVTTGDTIWDITPERDAQGRVLSLPFGRFYRWYRLGERIYPGHTYRATVVYDNPTGRTLVNGGMGNVAGIFVPADDDDWPDVDPDDPVFLEDLRNTLLQLSAMQMHHGAPGADANGGHPAGHH